MEFDPQALIYLALIVGYFLYELFVRSKKSGQQQPSSTGQEETPTVPQAESTAQQPPGEPDEQEREEGSPFDPIEGWFEEVKKQSGRPREPETPEMQQPTMEQPRRGLFEKKKEERAEKLASEESAYEPIEERKVAPIGKEKAKYEMPEAEVVEQQGGYFDEESFDLEKAIIFSAVLERKHF